MNTESTKTWGEIDRLSKNLAEKILDCISGNHMNLPYHSTNCDILRKWWTTKIRFFLQPLNGDPILLKQRDPLPEYKDATDATDQNTMVKTMVDLRRKITTNIRNFFWILDNVNLWENVLIEKNWDEAMKNELCLNEEGLTQINVNIRKRYFRDESDKPDSNELHVLNSAVPICSNKKNKISDVTNVVAVNK